MVHDRTCSSGGYCKSVGKTHENGSDEGVCHPRDRQSTSPARRGLARLHGDRVAPGDAVAMDTGDFGRLPCAVFPGTDSHPSAASCRPCSKSSRSGQRLKPAPVILWSATRGFSEITGTSPLARGVFPAGGCSWTPRCRGRLVQCRRSSVLGTNSRFLQYYRGPATRKV